MIKKTNWLENVKKAFSPDVKKHQSFEETEISYPVLVTRSRSSPPQFEVRVDEVNYEHKNKKNLFPSPPSREVDVHVDSTPSSPPESVPPPARPDRFAGKSKEEAAAILIQSTFRGHLARQEAKRMRRLVRVKLMMDGSVVKRQASYAKTLKFMHAFTRVQSQIQSRRIQMSEENQASHKQLLQKQAKETEGSKNGGNCNVRNESKKQVEPGLVNKHEATMRRERALSNASTHQQHLKSNVKPAITMFMDPDNLTWGWTWLERWTKAHKPCESPEKEQSNTYKPSVKASTNRNSHGGDTAKPLNRKKLSSSTQPNTPSTSSSTTRKNKPTTPSIRPKTTDAIAKNSEKNRRQSIARSSVSDGEELASSRTRRDHNLVPTKPADGIAKSSEKNRRHSIASSSVSDDEGLASLRARRDHNLVPTKPADESSEKNRRHSISRSSVSDDEGLARPRNMVPTKPTRGKLNGQTSSGVAAATKATTEESNGVRPVKAPAKKRASPAPKPRRSSATLKVENTVLKTVQHVV